MAYTSQCLLQIKAKPCVSLTAPNHNNFEQVSLTVWFFWMQSHKAEKLICESIAWNLEPDSLTRRLFSFGNGG